MNKIISIIAAIWLVLTVSSAICHLITLVITGWQFLLAIVGAVAWVFLAGFLQSCLD